MSNPGIISIALCTHNSGAYLREQLDSFVTQTLPADEIIVVDDCSKDSTMETLAAYGARLPLKIYANERQLGFVKSFERALSLCAYPYVFPSDHDDIWDADKLKIMMDAFAQPNSPDLVFSDSRLVDADGAALAPSFWQNIQFTPEERALFLSGRELEVLLRKGVVAGNTIGVKKKLLEGAMPVPAGWSHDEWLVAFASLTGRIALVERPLLSYRQHARQTIGVQRGLWDKIRRRWRRAGGRTWNDFALDHQKWQSLGQRTEKQSSDETKRELAGKISFQLSCANYPRARLLRIFPIANNLLNGNYRRYGSGAGTALRDALAGA